MQAKPWQQIESLYYQAIKLEQPERELFLQEVCKNDQVLFDELQTLLSFHQENSFAEKSLRADIAAELSKTRPNELASGRQFGVYKVIMLLGAGGMGEVYLAEDTRLKRKVALKILPPDLVHNAFLVNRLQQEARATSALNHPNVLTIYEVGQDASGIHFIAAEYIDGETLREILSSRRQLSLAEILDIALQTAAALAAVHATGVIHRDIKPQNIMLRRDGYVKVLDFGIAKLVDKRFSTQEDTSSPNTETGMILGTAHYMSPEQARGLKINAQTDLWSFGVTLYEMLAKRVPFAGATTSDVIVSILEREPPALAELVPNAPPELERIIKRCLSKDIAARYQSATELIEDLQEFQRQLQTNVGSKNPARRPIFQKSRVTAENNQQLTASGDTLPQPQSLRSKASTFGFKKNIYWKTLSAAFLVGLVTLITGVIATNTSTKKNWLPRLFSADANVLSLQPTRISRLTSNGNVAMANLSPDGKYLAYVVYEGGQQSLWLRQIAAPPARAIVPLAKISYLGLTFSPDSNFIYYVVYEKDKGKGVMYAVPLMGSEPRLVLENVESPPAFSPDGKSFAFIAGVKDQAVAGRALMTANIDGTELKTLATRYEPNLFSLKGFTWTNDGQKIIIATNETPTDGLKYMCLVEVQVADGTEKPFGLHQWKDIGRVTALKNGDILTTATEQTATAAQIYQLSSTGAEIQSITKDLNGYDSISNSSDAAMLTAVQSERISHIWTTTTDNLNQMNRITPGVGQYYWTSWTPDGKVIYMSEESGNQDVWIMDSDGRNSKQLTFDLASDSYPKVTPDNRYIVFASNRSGEFNFWRMNRDGGDLKMLNGTNVDKLPYFSLDNEFVYYTADISGNLFLTKLSIENGTTVKLFDFQSRHGDVSPDGKFIVCRFLDEKVKSKWQVGIASIADRKIVKTVDIPTNLAWQVTRWTKDGNAITYLNINDNIHNLWRINLIGEQQPTQLTHFNSSDQILYYDWSPDGKNLVCLRGQKVSDVVLLTTTNK